MEQMLFALLRLGLKTRVLEQEDVSELFSWSESKWTELLEMAREQGVAGIVLDGIKTVMDKWGTDCFNHFENRHFWSKFIISWAYGLVEKGYETGNEKQCRVIADIQKKWAAAELRMMLIKGQAIGTYYPEPMHRCPGDIDCYLFEGYDKGNKVAEAFADKVDESWYKHSVISYQGQTIENHKFFVHTREGKISKQLNQALCDSLDGAFMETFNDTGVLLPPPMFNALFLTYHAMTHFLEEGLKLKQLLDWAMFLRKDADKVDWQHFYGLCEKFHLCRFFEVATDIAIHYLGVRVADMQVATVSPYTVRVIQNTLNDRDYVFGSGQSGWTNRWQIIKNLYTYRWKYHFIYEHSVARQLWYYASGYLFKTE